MRKAFTTKEEGKREMSKPVYRQSNIYNYFDCPYKFKLSQHHEIPSTTAMEDGRLFEAMVLGPKDEIEKSELLGKRRPETVESYTSAVEHIKKIFIDGVSYKKMTYETDEWILQGEADFIGDIEISGKRYRTIADLKFTGSISRVWMEKIHKKDFLQKSFG